MKNIVIVGGGTAGWLTALYAKKTFPNDNVSVVQSKEIGILGAGEGSTPNLVALFDYLEIPVSDLISKAKATIKTGIKFTNWSKDNNFYYHDFGKKFTDLCSITAGHSLGEYSALCASGSFDIANTAKLLKIRGQAMAKCGASGKSKGAMAAILGADIIDILKLIEEVRQDEVCQIANDNSTGQIVISGSKSAIIRAIEKAKDFGYSKDDAIIFKIGELKKLKEIIN